jgi:hypothetical protein
MGRPGQYGPGAHQHRYGPQTQRTFSTLPAAGVKAGANPLAGIAEALPDSAPELSNTTAAAIAILTLLIAFLIWFAHKSPPQHSLRPRVTMLKRPFSRHLTTRLSGGRRGIPNATPTKSSLRINF